MRIPLFRIWYSTTYSILLVLLLLILAISPIDTIYQSVHTRELQKLFVIGGVYFLTFFIVMLIYSTRIYTNRTVLASIPKGYVPVEEGEVGRGVRKMIARELARSAVIAWDSRPRDLSREVDDVNDEGSESPGGTADNVKEKEKAYKKKRNETSRVPATILHISAKNPPWGHIAHPGWASPSSPDLPNLQYWSVICELPNLIEAKAVSLAPPDPTIEETGLQYPDNAPPLPDAQVVTLLQRPRAMGLREYLLRLSEFGLINPPNLGPKFLAQYEYARFSNTCLTEAEFRDLMGIFASILNGMTHLDASVIDEARAQSISQDNCSLAPTQSSSASSYSSTSTRSHAPYRTPLLQHQRSVSSSLSSASFSMSNSSSSSSASPRSARTAPSRQHQRSSATFATASPHMRSRSRSPSVESLAPSESAPSQSDAGSVVIHDTERRRSPSTILPHSSTSSLRSALSARSVLSLRRNAVQGELPYVYHLDGGG